MPCFYCVYYDCCILYLFVLFSTFWRLYKTIIYIYIYVKMLRGLLRMQLRPIYVITVYAIHVVYEKHAMDKIIFMAMFMQSNCTFQRLLGPVATLCWLHEALYLTC